MGEGGLQTLRRSMYCTHDLNMLKLLYRRCAILTSSSNPPKWTLQLLWVCVCFFVCRTRADFLWSTTPHTKAKGSAATRQAGKGERVGGSFFLTAPLTAKSESEKRDHFFIPGWRRMATHVICFFSLSVFVSRHLFQKHTDIIYFISSCAARFID